MEITKQRDWKIKIVLEDTTMIKKIAKYAGIALGTGLLCTNVTAATWERENIGGLNTSVYTPATSSPVGEGKSLLIVLHGCLQSNTAFQTANLDKAAEEYGMVVALPDAATKKGLQCWGYWTDGWAGSPRDRNKNDYKRLHDMTNQMINNPEYDIDPNQVYIAGLSSGASFAMTMGCMSPNLYAGIGVSAGPSPGTSESGWNSHQSTASQTASRCKSYAEGNADYFATQIASTAAGSSDSTVPQSYTKQNAEAMAIIYGVNKLSGTNSIEGKATETLWDGPDGKNRVSMLKLNGVSHAWSGGSGATGSYISGASINYGMYLGEYFANNNLRVDDDPCEGPECVKITGMSVDAAQGGSTATVTAGIVLPEGMELQSILVAVDNDSVEITDQNVTAINETFPVSQGDHTASIVVTVTDEEGTDYTTEKSTTFNNAPIVNDTPFWCVYIPELYRHYVPACAQ